MEIRDAEEQNEKLRAIADKIDTDHDGRVSPAEMRVYILQRIKFVSI